MPVAWLLTIVGLGDFANVGLIAVETGLLTQDLGAMWVILGWYVPAVTVAHFAIINLLLKARRDAVEVQRSR